MYLRVFYSLYSCYGNNNPCAVICQQLYLHMKPKKKNVDWEDVETWKLHTKN